MAKRQKVAAWRRRFLWVLGRTGNVELAALHAGVDKTTAYNHRNGDPRFAARWDAARAKGKAAAAAGKAARLGKASVELVLRDGKTGPAYVRAAEGRWCAAVEEAFFAALARTACVRWAAAAAAISTAALYSRRAKYADFAARWDAIVARAKTRIPELLTAATIASLDPEIDEADLPRVTIDQAIAIARLKCGPGGGGRGRDAAPEPSIEEVRDEVLRRIAAIRRHREKGKSGGGGGDA